MLIISLVTWWYGQGWLTLMRKVAGRIQGVLKFFSVGMLAASLFAPFRQISAGKVNGPLQVQLRAWADRQFSRGIGAVVRLLLIICGIALGVVLTVGGIVIVLAWPLLPVLPLVGLMFAFGSSI